MILSVDKVTFRYGSTPVLKDVRFTLRRGELLAILGPNGVGKSTLLKCINALHRPQRGSVLVDEENVMRMSPRKIARNIGYVAQHTEASRLTAYDAVLMGRKPHIRWKVSERDLKIVDSAIRRLGMKHLAMRWIDTMSGGELQKVAIARALVQEPRLLLLDEPSSALDMKNQMEILSLILRVVTEHHVAGIMTMHDLNTALRFAHKFLFLKDGKVYAAGRTGEMRPEMIEAVYGLPVTMIRHEGRPVILPVDPAFSDTDGPLPTDASKEIANALRN